MAARALAAAGAALIAVYAIHWVIEMIAFAVIGAAVFSGYQRMRGKLRDEKRKRLAVQAELDTARLLLLKNGLTQEDGRRRESFIRSSRGDCRLQAAEETGCPEGAVARQQKSRHI